MSAGRQFVFKDYGFPKGLGRRPSTIEDRLKVLEAQLYDLAGGPSGLNASELALD